MWTTGGLMMRVFVKTPSRRPCSSTTRRAGETGFWMKWRRAGKAGFWTKLVELILRRGIAAYMMWPRRARKGVVSVRLSEEIGNHQWPLSGDRQTVGGQSETYDK